MPRSLYWGNGKLSGEVDAHSWWMWFACFAPKVPPTVPVNEGRKWEARFLRRDSGGDIVIFYPFQGVVRI